MEISKYFQNCIDEGKLTGAAYVIWREDKELSRGVVGYSDLARTKSLQENAIFRLASMTKPITATAVMILCERDLLNLDNPIGKYIPFAHSGVGEFVNGKIRFVGYAREITIRDCLSHSSGLGSGELGSYQFYQRKQPFNLEENVRSWNGAFLDFEPRTRQAYSGLVAFELLALVAEKVSGMPFAEFLRSEIFEPLGMTQTKYTLTKEEENCLVDMTKTGELGNLEKVDFGLRGFDAFAEGYSGGSAGLFSTLDDYSRFVKMLACKGVWNGKRILQDRSVERMRSSEISIDDWQDWGLGVRVIKKQDNVQPLSIGSFGWSGAYGTHFWVEPQTGISAVLMLNKADVGGSNSVFSREFERLVYKN